MARMMQVYWDRIFQGHDRWRIDEIMNFQLDEFPNEPWGATGRGSQKPRNIIIIIYK